MTQATTFAELAAEAQRQTLTALKQAQDLSLRGAELTLRVPVSPGLNASEAIEGAFGFAAQVLQQQKAYALRMTEILTGASEPAPVKTK
jgi:pyruvate-formate lyase-activating enzyme